MLLSLLLIHIKLTIQLPIMSLLETKPFQFTNFKLINKIWFSVCFKYILRNIFYDTFNVIDKQGNTVFTGKDKEVDEWYNTHIKLHNQQTTITNHERNL